MGARGWIAGWIAVYRKAMSEEDALWNEPFDRWRARLDLFQMAAFRQGVRYRGEPLGRGEVLVSLRGLGRRWQWSIKQVRAFLAWLVEAGTLEHVRTTGGGSVYRIVKYDEYQSGHTQTTESDEDTAEAGTPYRDPATEGGPEKMSEQGDVGGGHTQTTDLEGVVASEGTTYSGHSIGHTYPAVGKGLPPKEGTAKGTQKNKASRRTRLVEEETKIECVSTMPLPEITKSSPRDKEAVLAERDALLDGLEAYAPGFRSAWLAWRDSLTARKRGTLWGQVLKLRRFYEAARSYGPDDVLDMVAVATEGAGGEPWQGFAVEWWERLRRRGRAGRGGFLPVDDERETTQQGGEL